MAERQTAKRGRGKEGEDNRCNLLHGYSPASRGGGRGGNPLSGYDGEISLRVIELK